MIGWLRRLSPPLRRSIYFFGVIIAFFLAVGVGATAMVVADRQFGRVATGPGKVSVLAGTGLETTGPGGVSTLEGTGLETTDPATTSESTETEQPDDANNANDTASSASFVHRAKDENSRGDYTYISDPSLDGHPNAIVLASSAADREDAAPYGHNIGVWYEPAANRWAIFNQDQTSIPSGAAFEVVVPQSSAAFVHVATPDNTVGNATYLNDPLTDGKPDAAVEATQNWNPGGGEGVYNDHPASVFYDGDVEQWAVYNRDGATMPEGAAFNVAVAGGSAR